MTSVCPTQVLHGADIPLIVRASVEPAAVDLVTTSLDYGLVRLRDSAALPLVLHNTSLTCWTEWSLSEIPHIHRASVHTLLAEGKRPLPETGREAASEEGGSITGTTRIEFERTSGTLAPGEQAVVMATLHADGGGAVPQYRSIVQLVCSGGSGPTSFLEALAVVVTPLATLSSPRVDLGATFVGVTVKTAVSISNLSLLPLDYRFSVECPGEEAPLAVLRIKPDRGVLQPGGRIGIGVDLDPHQAQQGGVSQAGGQALNYIYLCTSLAPCWSPFLRTVSLPTQSSSWCQSAGSSQPH